MAENEKMVQEMERKWEEKLAEAERENKVLQLSLSPICVWLFLLSLSRFCLENFHKVAKKTPLTTIPKKLLPQFLFIRILLNFLERLYFENSFE